MPRLLGLLLLAGIIVGASTARAAEPTTPDPVAPADATDHAGPLLDALAYLPPQTDDLEVEFIDWSGLKAQQGASDMTSLSPGRARQDLLSDIEASEAAPIPQALLRASPWNAQWGWDATDLEWQLRVGTSAAVFRFGQHWDSERIISKLEGHKYKPERSGASVTYRFEPHAWNYMGSDLERAILDLPEGTPGHPRADVTIIEDTRTLIIDRSMVGPEMASRAASADPEAVASSPFGRVAATLSRPLSAVIRSGALGCSPSGEKNGLLRGDAVPLARSAGHLRPYRAYGAGYERPDEGESVGRYVFDYDTPKQARVDLKARRTLFSRGVLADGRKAYRDAAFRLERAVVEGREQLFDVRPIADHPNVVFDLMDSEPALFAMCGQVPAARPLARLPVSRVPLFVGPATLKVSGGRGAYSWDELHFGADQIRVKASVKAGQAPCSARLRLDDKDGRVATANFAAAPRKASREQQQLGVDYATTEMRVDSTCDSWSLRFEPVRDPDLKYSIKRRYYPVRGRTLGELSQDLDRIHPDWDARAKSRTLWHYWWTVSGSSCHVTHGDVEVKSSILMPKWKRPKGVESYVVARWDRFIRTLYMHEQGHVTISLQGANAIDERLDAGLSTSCERVSRKANKTANNVLARWRKANKRYDKETDHGIAQGTAFP